MWEASAKITAPYILSITPSSPRYHLYIVVMVSWVYMYLQTHQVIYIKYIQFFVFQSYLIKVFLNDIVALPCVITYTNTHTQDLEGSHQSISEQLSLIRTSQ